MSTSVNRGAQSMGGPVMDCANQTSLMRYDLRPVEPRLSPIRILPLHVCQRAVGSLESQRVGNCANQTSLLRYDFRPVEPRISPIRFLPLNVCQRVVGSLESQRVGNCANQTSLSSDMIFGQSSLGCHRFDSCH